MSASAAPAAHSAADGAIGRSAAVHGLFLQLFLHLLYGAPGQQQRYIGKFTAVVSTAK